MLLQLVQSSCAPSCLKAEAFNSHSKSYPTQILLQATMWNPHNFRQLNQIKEYKNNYLLLGHRDDMAYIWTQPSLLWELIAMGKVSTRPSKPAGPGTVHGHNGLCKPDPFKLKTGSPSLKFSCLKERNELSAAVTQFDDSTSKLSENSKLLLDSISQRSWETISNVIWSGQKRLETWL